MDLRERYIETNGIKLHVMEAGPEDGPMMLFLHGFPEFWYAWRKQLPFFVQKGYRVVAPDQRGYNLSDKPEGVAAYNIDELAKDIIGLLDAYGQKQVRLVGHDWGASVSWWLALKYAERISKMVILNVPHPKVMAKHLFTDSRQMPKSWYIFYFQLPGAVEHLAASTNYDFVLELISSNAKPGAFTPEDLGKYRQAFAQPGAFSAMVNWYRAMIQTKALPPKSFNVTVPLLFLWGEEDIAMIPEMADESMPYCTEGRLVKLPGVTHWIQHEEASRVNEAIETFMR
jgi:epoxide hydrolase 4